MPDCLLVIRVGPTTVTKADRLPLGNGIQFPPGSRFTLPAAAAMLGFSCVAMRQIVHRLKDHLDPPRYWQRRTRGDFRLRRVLSQQDLDAIKSRTTLALRTMSRGKSSPS